MSFKNSSVNKARFWVAILYVENLIEDWQLFVNDLAVPYCYCVHDMDRDSQSEHRKDHVHLMLVFPNTTTRKHVIDLVNGLSVPGTSCCSTAEACISVRHSYDYLIHDTETCRKQGKFLYPVEARICGNNFDVGFYEQLSAQDRALLIKNLVDFCIEGQFVTYNDFYNAASVFYDEDVRYLQLLFTYSGLFERVTKSNYFILSYSFVSTSPRHHESCTTNVSPAPRQHHASTTPAPRLICPGCGSVSVKKDGFTKAGSRRFRCKDCGKKWS